MRSIHFDAQGFSRTYWDFFSAFGLFFSVFLLFAALLAWQLGGLPAETFARMRSEEHTSELQSLRQLVCRLLLEKKNQHETDSVDEQLLMLARRIYVRDKGVYFVAL